MEQMSHHQTTTRHNTHSHDSPACYRWPITKPLHGTIHTVTTVQHGTDRPPPNHYTAQYTQSRQSSMLQMAHHQTTTRHNTHSHDSPACYRWPTTKPLHGIIHTVTTVQHATDGPPPNHYTEQYTQSRQSSMVQIAHHQTTTRHNTHSHDSPAWYRSPTTKPLHGTIHTVTTVQHATDGPPPNHYTAQYTQSRQSSMVQIAHHQTTTRHNTHSHDSPACYRWPTTKPLHGTIHTVTTVQHATDGPPQPLTAQYTQSRQSSMLQMAHHQTTTRHNTHSHDSPACYRWPTTKPLHGTIHTVTTVRHATDGPPPNHYTAQYTQSRQSGMVQIAHHQTTTRHNTHSHDSPACYRWPTTKPLHGIIHTVTTVQHATDGPPPNHYTA